MEADRVIVTCNVHAAALPGHWSGAMLTHKLPMPMPMPVRAALAALMVRILWAFAVTMVAGTEGATMATARSALAQWRICPARRLAGCGRGGTS